MYQPLNLGTHITRKKPVKHNYYGQEDEITGLSEGIGSIIYNTDDHIQYYQGKLIWNNMHGYGEYKWQPSGFKYEGQFYANTKEGYGRCSYPSGAYFEGLYRNDYRFGPGIFTDTMGYQNVGIWLTSKLIRLSRTIEDNHSIPRLAVTQEDQIRLLQFRTIIHLQKVIFDGLLVNIIFRHCKERYSLTG
ncbi:phosphatidylinositol 4-phosphate 5-kinase 3-like [Athalia rosae]|uniref:phosphatidylinositol 4-phosphate 5-kinase 3-like n=1 Tax=Athalia rosae TaxID=37344 RepID=UPI00203488D4|nr:phosphatidylinositol 4-phosphate 5-kinase 3-like [Athalia rosae]